MRDVLSDISDWINSFGAEAIPNNVADALKKCILDTEGVMIAGRLHEVSRHASKYIELEESAGASSLIGGGTTSARNAAFVNGVSAHVYDYDDTSYAGIVHASSIVWSAALAVAESRDQSGRDLFSAFAVGVELIYAIGKSIGAKGFELGHWNTALLGPLGAAAAAAFLMDLSKEKIMAAIAHAAAGGFGINTVYGSDAKPILVGVAASRGVDSAEFAKCGLSGPLRIFEEGGSWSRLLAHNAIECGPVADLGRKWSIVDPGVIVKRSPVCSAAASAIDAVETIAKESRIDCSEIKTIDCLVAEVGRACLSGSPPATQAEAQFSIPFILSCVLVRGGVGIDHLRDEAWRDERIGKLMRLVRLSFDHAFERQMRDENAIEAAEVSITTVRARYRKRIAFAAGSPQNPFTSSDMRRKFFDCARAGRMSDENANARWSSIDGIQRLGSARGLRSSSSVADIGNG